ncbi:hypothetical protein HW555_005570, partial [Spodoptera exigua]
IIVTIKVSITMAGRELSGLVMKTIWLLYFFLLCFTICTAQVFSRRHPEDKYPHMKPWRDVYCSYYPQRC